MRPFSPNNSKPLLPGPSLQTHFPPAPTVGSPGPIPAQSSLDSTSSSTLRARSASSQRLETNEVSGVLLCPPTALHLNDSILAISRQVTHLQQSLQTFLDAQSAGLLAGLGRSISRPQQFTASSLSGTRTPTSTSTATSAKTHSPRARNVTPVWQPRPKQIGLQGARRGLLLGLQELASAKSQESDIISAEVAAYDSELREISDTRQRREGLEAGLQGVKGLEYANELKAEENRLKREIQEYESHLRVLHESLRAVRQDREVRESKVDSSRSSWVSAIEELDKEIDKRWLVRRGTPRSKGGRREIEGTWTLPRQQPTLETVQEAMADNKRELELLQQGVEREREACTQGTIVWQNVVTTVEYLEGGLRAELAKTRDIDADYLSPGTGSHGDDGEHAMHAVIAHMSTAIETLQSHLEHAERQDWKLLICAIGAELEALKEGREMLAATLNEAEPLRNENAGGASISDPETNNLFSHKGLVADGHTYANGLLPQKSRRINDHAGGSLAELVEHARDGEDADEDDGPGIELLVEVSSRE